MYYIEKDNKIVLVDSDLDRLRRSKLLYPDYAGLDIKETDSEHTVYNFEIMTYDEARDRSEEYVNYLTMTSLDFINTLRSFGLSLEQIRSYLSNNIELDTQLTYCSKVFCGVVRKLLPIEYEGITITDDMIVQAFKAKNNIN